MLSIVESLPNILPKIFDKDLSNFIKDKLTKYVKIYDGYSAKEIESKNGKIVNVLIRNDLELKDYKIETDLIILATGTKPVLKFLNNSNIGLGKTGRIIINNKCETSIKDVYAVGDSLRDLQAAVELGCLPVLVKTGKGEKTAKSDEFKAFTKIMKNTNIFD